jgi:hypothetical protein
MTIEERDAAIAKIKKQVSYGVITMAEHDAKIADIDRQFDDGSGVYYLPVGLYPDTMIALKDLREKLIALGLDSASGGIRAIGDVLRYFERPDNEAVKGGAP